MGIVSWIVFGFFNVSVRVQISACVCFNCYLSRLLPPIIIHENRILSWEYLPEFITW